MKNDKAKCPECGQIMLKRGLPVHRKFKHGVALETTSAVKNDPVEIEAYRKGYRDGWKDRAA